MLLFSTMLEIDESLTKSAFIELILEWNRSSPHQNNIIKGIDWHGERTVRYGTDDLWLSIKECRKKNTIAVRYEKKDEFGVVWDSDYIMNFDTMIMAIRLDRSYVADATIPNYKFSNPYFISLLIKNGYLKADGELNVSGEPIFISKDNIKLLTGIINRESKHRLPVVYVAKTYNNEDPVDISYLAKKLKGVAHILVQEDIRTNQRIREATEGNNEYLGAVGIYYPNQAVEHRRYLYRRFDGGKDTYLSEKVIRTVLQYNNSQRLDTLYTWQGVNNALLLEELANQLEKRQAAEKAQKEAEAETLQIQDSLDEEGRRIRRQAIDDARAEANKLLESFDEDLERLQDQIEELTRTNEALQAENQGLRTKLDGYDSIPLLYTGDEYDFYPGEIKDLILSVLSDALLNMQPKSRRADVVRDIIKSNNFQELSEQRAEKIKTMLRSYKGITGKMRQELEDLGFVIGEDGKHYKITYFSDGRYQATLAKTPSDVRAGKNNVAMIVKMLF